MNYIVLDLEWNQCPSGKANEDPALPFEIIELGAIKLNEHKERIGEFGRKIQPQVYHSLHYRTKQLLKIDLQDYSHAKIFPDVMKEFLHWCGPEPYKFCTWGPMDLEELQRNMDFYHIRNPFPKPLYYYDLQKLFSLLYEDGKSRKSLEYAVDYLNLPKNNTFHHALQDTDYTVQIMQHMNLEQVKEYDSVDYHRPPLCRKEEIYIVFHKYAKYVSMLFDTKENLLSDHTVTSTYCYQCGQILNTKIRWFPTGNNVYYSLALCPTHGILKGKIRIKKFGSNRYFAIKTLKLISEEEATTIRLKQDAIRMKRRAKRQHKQ
jgi:inhibitor of KinA sporulation pathway (predicted exonuclease)